MTMRKLFMVWVLVALLFSAGPGTALADEPPPGAVPSDELRLGPPPGYPSDEPWPGAVVHREVVRPLGGEVQSLDGGVSPMVLYRSGWTDGWWEWHYPEFYLIGSHDSDSDLVEDDIKVDGFMDVQINGTWDDDCLHHTSGTHAHCNTERHYYFKYSFYAESHHFFHKAGYQDQYFETGKTV